MSFQLGRLQAAMQNRLQQKTLREAAAEAGISPATMSRVLRGHLPDLPTFASLLVWLEVDATAFFDHEGDGKPPEELWGTLSQTMHQLHVPPDMMEAVLVLLRLVVKEVA